MRLNGITVSLLIKKQNGTDEFGEPIYTTSKIDVDNVLVAPTSSDDMVNAQNLYGKRAVYTLAIPKGDQNEWRDTEVSFFGKTWRTFGIPIEGIEKNIPLSWNKKVMVECIE